METTLDIDSEENGFQPIAKPNSEKCKEYYHEQLFWNNDGGVGFGEDNIVFVNSQVVKKIKMVKQ